jgi:3-deoxy-D-manno-octulosonic-acid transferase
MGILPKGTKKLLRSKKVIWFHSASVGEVRILPTIVPKLKKLIPEFSIVISTLTKTGKIEAGKIIPEADLVFYAPVDIPFFVKKTIKKVNPFALILVETELWPNLIKKAKEQKAFVALINGRLSAKSFPQYLRFRSLFSLVLSYFNLLCMRTDEDAERAKILGAEPEKIKIVGNLKFDQMIPRFDKYDKEAIRKSLGISNSCQIIVAGSIREGEEKIILDVFQRLRKENPSFLLILAPRHLNQINLIEEYLLGLGLKFRKKTEIDKKSIEDQNYSVILLDTMGELFSIYCIADVAFVGGSLVPSGGHNILEPAIWGVPVIFGPHIDDFKFAASCLIQSGGGIMVESEDELYQSFSGLLKDEKLRKHLGQKGKKAVEKQRGAAEQTVRFLLEGLNRRFK